MKDSRITLIVVEHRDRLTRFGFHYLEPLLEAQGCKTERIVQELEANGDEP